MFSRKKNIFKIFFASSLAFFKTKQNWSWPWPIFNKSKNSAVLEPRTGHFRGLAGFEGKAKDSKLCPWGLHLSAAEQAGSNSVQLDQLEIWISHLTFPRQTYYHSTNRFSKLIATLICCCFVRYFASVQPLKKILCTERLNKLIVLAQKFNATNHIPCLKYFWFFQWDFESLLHHLKIV